MTEKVRRSEITEPQFHNVLDEVLSNKTKVKLLRAFFTYPEKEFTESELQRIAGIPQASAHRRC